MKRLFVLVLVLCVCTTAFIEASADKVILYLSTDATSIDVQTVLNASEDIKYSEVIIPSSVMSINASSFLYARFDSVQDYWVAPRNPFFCSVEGVIFSKDGSMLIAFPRGRMITDYIVPEGVEIIGRDAFAETGVDTVVLPSSLRIIEECAFCESAISHIVFNEGLEQIGRRAFGSCASLQEVEFPSTLKSIGDMAFSECTLRNVTIPEGVEAIGYEAFFYCPLESIRLPSTILECGELIIGRNNSTPITETTTIIVPMGSMIDMYITETMGYYPIIRETN